MTTRCQSPDTEPRTAADKRPRVVKWESEQSPSYYLHWIAAARGGQRPTDGISQLRGGKFEKFWCRLMTLEMINTLNFESWKPDHMYNVHPGSLSMSTIFVSPCQAPQPTCRELCGNSNNCMFFPVKSLHIHISTIITSQLHVSQSITFTSTQKAIVIYILQSVPDF